MTLPFIYDKIRRLVAILILGCTPLAEAVCAQEQPETDIGQVTVPLATALDSIHPAGPGLLLGLNREKRLVTLLEAASGEVLVERQLDGEPISVATRSIEGPEGSAVATLVITRDGGGSAVQRLVVGRDVGMNSYETLEYGIVDKFQMPAVAFSTPGVFGKSATPGVAAVVWDTMPSTDTSLIALYGGQTTGPAEGAARAGAVGRPARPCAGGRGSMQPGSHWRPDGARDAARIAHCDCRNDCRRGSARGHVDK